MNKHSPAPWQIIEDCGKTQIIEPEEDAAVCQMCKWEEEYFNEQQGNARLIASAPELLLALQAIIARWDTPSWKDAKPTGEIIDIGRKAVAKATGGA
jgi:hypothetical protein